MPKFAVLAGLGFTVVASATAAAPQLGLPIRCEIGRTCEVQNYVDADPGPAGRDYRCLGRTYQGHAGVDIRLMTMAQQRAGVEVLAAAPGRVVRLRDGVEDISIRAAGAKDLSGQECGNGVVVDHGGGWETQYCHMAKGSIVVRQGQDVAAGAPLGKVGLSGQTEFPHVHMTVREGARNVDPFAPNARPGSCAAGEVQGLWTPAAAKALAYKRGAILNGGFAGGPVTQEQIEDQKVAPATREQPALVAYVRAIGLEKGDVVRLVLKDPAGNPLAQQQVAMDADKAAYFLFVGKKRPATGWPAGAYTADYEVVRKGAPALTRQFRLSL